MAYETLIEQAKKYLSGTNDDNAFEQYYENARQSVKNEYKTSEKTLEHNYQQEQNAAAAKNALDARNNDQYLAARGLSRSGESAQEHINANLSLNSSLSDLASSNMNALNSLLKNKNSALSSLEQAYAEHHYNREQWLTELSMQLAQAEMAVRHRGEDQAREERLLEEERKYRASLLDDEQMREDRLRTEEAERADMLLKNERAYAESKTASDRAYAESQTAETRAYEQQKLAENRAYQEKLTEEQRQYDALLLDAQNALEAQIRAQEQADKERLLTAERAYNDKVRAEQQAYQTAASEAERNYQTQQTLEKREYEEKKADEARDFIQAGTDVSEKENPTPENNPSEPDSSYTPKSSARDIAKALIATASGGEAYTGSESQNLTVYQKLQEIENNTGLDQDYRNDLLLNLQTLGYTKPSTKLLQASSLFKASKSVYQSALQKASANDTDALSIYEARQTAEKAQMEYLYQRATSVEVFYSACALAGIKDSSVASFLQTYKEKILIPNQNTGGSSSGKVLAAAY